MSNHAHHQQVALHQGPRLNGYQVIQTHVVSTKVRKHSVPFKICSQRPHSEVVTCDHIALVVRTHVWPWPYEDGRPTEFSKCPKTEADRE